MPDLRTMESKSLKLLQVQPSFILSLLLLWMPRPNVVHVFGLGLSVTKGRITSSNNWNPYNNNNVRSPSLGGRLASIYPFLLRGDVNVPKTQPLLTARLRQDDDDDNIIRINSIFQRRSLLRHVVPLVVGTSFIMSSSATTSKADILQVGQCSGGVGEGCVGLSEGNDYIRSLQEKSAKNRDLYAKQALDAYQLKNYPDYFSSVGRFLVKKPDGTFILLKDNELNELKKAGKISVEQPPKVLGGKITDFSQKPILVLRD